ncbi:MAG: hypothetical protein R3E31_25830 [Chloroflexota bacterium]
MLIQQNNGPLVVLALILLALAVLVGILLSGTEIVNPTERIQMASIAELAPHWKTSKQQR